MSKRISLDGITSLSDTPTTSRSSNSCNDSSSLEDINYLLYLETLKRFKEEENNLRRQVEDKARQYEDVQAEYRYFYDLYVQLYQAGVTRGALEEDHHLPGDQLSQAKSDISSIMERVNNDKTIGYFNSETLEQCKELLHCMKNYDEAQKIQSEMADQKAAVQVIQSLNEAIQLKLETATFQSLDYFVELIQAKQMENSIIQGPIESGTNLEE